jgi:aerobic carbon-monoxide dehydrogenase medium subunit
MKPPRFDYLRPRSIDEALGVLARHDDEAKVLAGGQSLVPLLSFRLVRPALHPLTVRELQ